MTSRIFLVARATLPGWKRYQPIRLRMPFWAPAVLLLAAMLLWWGSAPAIAQDAALEGVLDDDLGLIAYADDMRRLSRGDRTWEVWTCDVGGPLSLNLPSVATLLNEQVAPYFSWLSAGRYNPSFVSRGTVQSQDQSSCGYQVRRAGGNQSRPAVIIADDPYLGGQGGPGPSFQYDKGVVWVSGARVLVGGGAVVSTRGREDPALGTVVHEMGHALAFPHSFSGLNFWEQDGEIFRVGDVYEYDNPMDMMSAGDYHGLSLGTIAVNRYAAGWIDPEEVAIYEEGEATYELSPLGVEGDQMLVITSESGPGVFYTLGARVAQGYDRDIPTEGVEVYLVDQRTTACEAMRLACWGLNRRTQPVPADDDPNTTLHVLEVGDGLDLGRVRVEITGRTGDRFTVQVGGMEPEPPEAAGELTLDTDKPTQAFTCERGEYVGRFCDEDDSVHAENIETMAVWGITRGCGERRFCPQDLITRAQMSAFLYRAWEFEFGPTGPVDPVVLEDVGADAWYGDFAEWAVSSGIMFLEEGLFNPSRVVTRADMAEMMTGAFADLLTVAQVEGLFSDTTGLGESTLTAVESLYRAGVSLGCSTSLLQFCPDQPVTREQMASFFVRAINNLTDPANRPKK